MGFRMAGLVAFAMVCSLAGAQTEGIGDRTFPTLGNTGYRATHYDLKLNFKPETNLLRADVTMTAVAGVALSKFSVDFSGFTISSVRLNGVTVPYERTSAKLRIKPKAPLVKGTRFTLETVYSGNPKQAQSAALPPGFTSGWITYPGGAIAACEPELAHTWFPCNDHPLNKATFEIEITTPRPYVAVANGIGSSVKPGTMRFVLDKPSMTCMATVAIGGFGILKQVGPKGLPITNYVPKGQESRFKQPLEVDPKFIQYLSERIGPYPFETYGTVMLPEDVGKVNQLMASSAIETTTIPLFGSMGAANPGTLCHELSHQWIGDCVSVTNWGNDIWWVEGFAQYAEWLHVEMTQGRQAYADTVRAAFEPYSGPGRWLKPGHLSAQEMFGAQSYIGGALILHALRRDLGDAKFFEAIKAFVAKNRYGNGSVRDWIEVSSKVSGRDMKPFFAAWLNGSTAPKFAR